MLKLIYPLCFGAWQYPEGIGKYEYLPNFAVRGLHYDIQKVKYFIPPPQWNYYFTFCI